MSLSPNDTQSVLEMLADIRRAQNTTIERLAEERCSAMRIQNQMDKLAGRVSRLRSAIPKEPTNPRVVGLSRDVKEFRADVSALKDRVDALVAMTKVVKTDTAAIKTTLDIIQTRFEE